MEVRHTACRSFSNKSTRRSKAEHLKLQSRKLSAAADNWSGFYFGVNGGYASGSTGSGLVAGDPISTFLLSGGHGETGRQNGALVGVQAGYNWIFNQRFLAGLEADLQHSAVSSNSSYIFNLANYSGRT